MIADRYTDDLAALTTVLIDHQGVAHDPATGQPQRCLCGHRYRLGDSLAQHTAEMILAAGFTNGARSS